jgi:UDP-N-acetylmuramoylalanine--D-glutamate ligase
MEVSRLEEKRFSVIGAARSGVAVARLLKSHGARVFLSEMAPAEKMQQARTELEQADIQYEFGGNSERILESEVIVLSPGVPSDAPLVAGAAAKGLRIVSEIEVASWFCPAPILAVTGTNGKTTTTTLLGRIFDDAKRDSVVAGNIGIAFSQVVGTLTDRSTAILEVSSFQLDFVETFRPRVAILLNITPDHLDRYNHSFDNYAAAKCKVFRNQEMGDTLVYNWDDPVTRSSVEKFIRPSVRKLPFSTRKQLAEGARLVNGHVCIRMNGEESDVIAAREISIKGEHNMYNAMAAALASKAMGVPTPSLRATLKNFKGVEHRLEFVRDVNGISYVNDSKATNVDSVWYALQSFDRPIIVMLGGRDKGNDYSALVELVRRNVKAVVAIGESADKVVRAFTPIVHVSKAKSMEEAVHTAAGLASAGDVVLLSPACASFDWFENYEHRGRAFKQIVATL